MAEDTPLTRLKKIGKYIEKREGGAAAEPDEESRELGDLIARVRARDEKLVGPKKFEEKLDFTKVSSASLAKAAAPGFVKDSYSMFKKPVSRLAQVMARFPVAADLQSLLESAGYSTNPETFLVIVSATALVAGVLALVVVGAVGAVLGDASIVAVAPFLAVVVLVLTAVLRLFSLSSKANSRAKKVDRALPFALRQIATQVKAGVSFHKSLASVANANYGVLSQEFNKLLADLERGLSTEEALTRLSNRTRSKSLKKAITQIIRAFKTGGNLSQVIGEIASEVSFETRMSVRDFTEKLNFINILFIMVAVVAPVATTIMSAILQIPLFSSGIPGYFIYVSFAGIIAAMGVLLYITKQMEPTAW